VDVSGYHHADSIRIERAPGDLYGIVSDLASMGELSPVCTSCRWDDAAGAGEQGSWFTGRNAIGDLTWETRCRVVVADPGRDFTFVVCGFDGKADLVRWGYTFEGFDGGTTVTESWQVLPGYPEFLKAEDPNADLPARIDGMADLARDGMGATLRALKAMAEA
jgi:Polyketide cyclase / dehydrase and lipid transport